MTLPSKDPILARELFTDGYQLIDLHRIPEESLKDKVWLGAMIFVMKHIHAPDILPHLLEIRPILKEIGGINFLYIEAIFT
jgi:hypothetical protein